MFYKCDRLLSIPDIFMWDTSKIINMEYLFFGCKSLQYFPNISKWKTSNVKNMKYMFVETNLKSLPGISKWDTYNLNYMEGMFYGLDPDISLWNISNVIDFPLIYYNIILGNKIKHLFLIYFNIYKIPLKTIENLKKLINFNSICIICKEYIFNISNKFGINDKGKLICAKCIKNYKCYYLSKYDLLKYQIGYEFYDYIFVIGIFGIEWSGKTSILHYFKEGNILKNPGLSNLESFNKNIVLNNKKIQIYGYDFTGYERFYNLNKKYLNSWHGTILVFSVTDDRDGKLFYELEKNLEDYKSINEKNNKQIYLVGNKIDDTNKRIISKEDATKFAKKHNLKYFETSAKTGENIKDLFESFFIDLMKIYSKITI